MRKVPRTKSSPAGSSAPASTANRSPHQAAEGVEYEYDRNPVHHAAGTFGHLENYN
jgi:hypothetical protein